MQILHRLSFVSEFKPLHVQTRAWRPLALLLAAGPGQGSFLFKVPGFCCASTGQTGSTLSLSLWPQRQQNGLCF